jgi:hypothetical protein
MEKFDNLARTLEQWLGFAEGRLRIEGELESGIPGKGLLAIEGSPKLTPEEDARVEEALRALNKLLGGSPPIKSSQA